MSIAASPSRIALYPRASHLYYALWGDATGVAHRPDARDRYASSGGAGPGRQAQLHRAAGGGGRQSQQLARSDSLLGQALARHAALDRRLARKAVQPQLQPRARLGLGQPRVPGRPFLLAGEHHALRTPSPAPDTIAVAERLRGPRDPKQVRLRR